MSEQVKDGDPVWDQDTLPTPETIDLAQPLAAVAQAQMACAISHAVFEFATQRLLHGLPVQPTDVYSEIVAMLFAIGFNAGMAQGRLLERAETYNDWSPR